MNDAKREQLFDLRTVERNIEHGLITRAEYQAYLEGLDDAAKKGLKVEATFQAGVLHEAAEDEEE